MAISRPYSLMTERSVWTPRRTEIPLLRPLVRRPAIKSGQSRFRSQNSSRINQMRRVARFRPLQGELAVAGDDDAVNRINRPAEFLVIAED